MTPLYAVAPSYLQDADLIIDKGNGILYVCKLSRFAERGQGVDVNTEPHWQIKRIREFTDDNGNKCTDIMFPHGNDKFDFRIDEIDSYQYEYKR